MRFALTRSAVGLALTTVVAASLAAQDTTSTKRSLLAADRDLATQLAARGVAAFFDRVTPDVAMLIPDAPTYQGPDAARAALLARYPRATTRLQQEAQHAVVGTDGLFGCTVGVTRLFEGTDMNKETPRYGRYIACWHREALNKTWALAGYTRTNDAPNAPMPNADLEHPPHSAVMHIADAAAQLRAAQDADSAFAAVSPKAGPGEAFGLWAAADAMMLGGAPKPRQGPAAIRDAFKGFPKNGQFEWGPVRTLGAAGGGLAFTSGEAFNVVNGKRSNTKYITVWRLEPDGNWRFIFDSGSDRP